MGTPVSIIFLQEGWEGHVRSPSRVWFAAQRVMSKMVASLCVASLQRFFLLGNGSLTHMNETICVHSLALKPAWSVWSWPCSHTVVWPYKGLVSDGSTSNPTLCSLHNAVPSVLSPTQCEALASCLLLIDSVLWRVSVWGGVEVEDSGY